MIDDKEDAADLREDCDYKLSNFVIHIGPGANSGHHHAVVRSPNDDGERSDECFDLNDLFVQLISQKKVDNHCGAAVLHSQPSPVMKGDHFVPQGAHSDDPEHLKLITTIRKEDNLCLAIYFDS